MEEVGKKVIQGFYRGEEWASRLVFQTYRRLIYFAIRSVLPGKEDAEDAYLETFARLFKKQTGIWAFQRRAIQLFGQIREDDRH